MDANFNALVEIRQILDFCNQVMLIFFEEKKIGTLLRLLNLCLSLKVIVRNSALT